MRSFRSIKFVQKYSVSNLQYYYDLTHSLVDREMKLLYKRSLLGVAWTLISPLLQLMVFIFIFQIILPVDIPQYSSFVFTGLLVWTWFQNSLFQATGVIISNRPLIRQPGFPSAILPAVTVTTGLVHLILALPVLLVFLMIDRVEFEPVVFLLPLLLFIQFGLTVSFSYFLSALNVTFRDTQHTLGVLLQLWFYMTPIFYDLKNVPEKYQFAYSLNPMVNLVDAYRSILMYGSQPNWQSLFITVVIMMIALPIGVKVFRRQSIRFVEEI